MVKILMVSSPTEIGHITTSDHPTMTVDTTAIHLMMAGIAMANTTTADTTTGRTAIAATTTVSIGMVATMTVDTTEMIIPAMGATGLVDVGEASATLSLPGLAMEREIAAAG